MEMVLLDEVIKKEAPRAGKNVILLGRVVKVWSLPSQYMHLGHWCSGWSSGFSSDPSLVLGQVVTSQNKSGVGQCTLDK